MSDSSKKVEATRKKRIAPVTVTIEVTFSKVNENGTFSGGEGKITKQSVKGSELYLSMPWKSGGAMYVKTLDLQGITVLGEDSADTGKKKLF